MYNWHSGPNALATEPNDARERERKKGQNSWRRRHGHTRKQNQNVYDTPASAIYYTRCIFLIAKI